MRKKVNFSISNAFVMQMFVVKNVHAVVHIRFSVFRWFNLVTPELTIWALFVTNICDIVWRPARPVSVTNFHIHKLGHRERGN